MDGVWKKFLSASGSDYFVSLNHFLMVCAVYAQTSIENSHVYVYDFLSYTSAFAADTSTAIK